MVIKGTYLHFVKPSLLPWLIAAAVVLIALAVASIVRDLRHGQAEDHGHRHRPWLVWLLLVPIALTTFLVPPPLGAQGTAPEAVAATAPPKRAFPPLPAGRSPTVSIPDVVMRAAADSTNSLDNRLITITGFTLRYPQSTDLGRVVIVCCAAPVAIWFWQSPTWGDLLWFLAAGLCGTLGHICQQRGYQLADITLLQPIGFLSLLWNTLLGFFLFSQQPDAWTFVGAAVIFASAMYISHREAVRRARVKSAVGPAGPAT